MPSLSVTWILTEHLCDGQFAYLQLVGVSVQSATYVNVLLATANCYDRTKVGQLGPTLNDDTHYNRNQLLLLLWSLGSIPGLSEARCGWCNWTRQRGPWDRWCWCAHRWTMTRNCVVCLWRHWDGQSTRCHCDVMMTSRRSRHRSTWRLSHPVKYSMQCVCHTSVTLVLDVQVDDMFTTSHAHHLYCLQI